MNGVAAQTLHLLAAAAMAWTPASAASESVPPQLWKDLPCMARVARAMPGIDRVVTGTEPRADHWHSPYIEYRITRHGQTATIHFSVGRSRRRHDGGYDYGFVTVLNGFLNNGYLNDWGADALVKEWKTRCDVDASGIYQ